MYITINNKIYECVNELEPRGAIVDDVFLPDYYDQIVRDGQDEYLVTWIVLDDYRDNLINNPDYNRDNDDLACDWANPVKIEKL